MLSDSPSPEDLPQAPTGYAALPPSYTRPGYPGGPGGSGAAPTGPGPAGSGPAGSGPAGSGSAGSGPAGRGRSRLRPVLAVLAVVAVLGTVGLGVWRAGNPPTTAQTTPPPAGGSQGAPGGSSGPGVTPTHPPVTNFPAALREFYTQQVVWNQCPGASKQQCATIEVPVDYAKPHGDRFTLALRKAPATDPSKRIGSLLVNPGGPGVSGVDFVQTAGQAFKREVLAAYDVVGFDPRGIGLSDPVDCLTDRDMDSIFNNDPTPDSAAERAQVRASMDGLTEHCAAKGGNRAKHMSTTEVARDMDIIRVLVGDQKLNFFGGSYGTFLGALYADLFPKQVGRMVLDSAMSPNQTDVQGMTYDIQGFESSMGAFLDWCVARTDCALGRDKSAAQQKLIDLLDKVEADGLRTSLPGLSRIGEGWANFGIFMSLYSDQFWKVLNKALDEAINEGKGDLLVAVGSAFTDRRPSGKYSAGSYLQAVPVRCSDWPRTPDTPALLAWERKAQAEHPLWARLNGELYDSCRTWPGATRQLKGTTLGLGAAPILVIGNERDPLTPIGGTKQLAKDLASGVLLTSNHDGHGTYNRGSRCVDSAVDKYLLQGTPPANGTSC